MVTSEDEKKLDNPVWFSLSETHQEFLLDYTTIKFYHPDYCPFGGFQTNEGISNAIDQYSSLVDNFFIVGKKPAISSQLAFRKELVCLQMIVGDKINLEVKEPITALTYQHADALFQFVTLVQPGYFRKKTAMLGNYFGILKKMNLLL